MYIYDTQCVKIAHWNFFEGKKNNMQFSEITSSQNPSVKRLVKLRDRRPREKEKFPK